MHYLYKYHSIEIDVDIVFSNTNGRLFTHQCDTSGKLARVYIFHHGENIEGKVIVKTSNPVEFQQMQLTLCGRKVNKTLAYSHENFLIDVIFLTKDVIVSGGSEFPFSFQYVPKFWSSISVSFVDITYFLSLTLVRSRFDDDVYEFPILVKDIHYMPLTPIEPFEREFNIKNICRIKCILKSIELNRFDTLIGNLSILDLYLDLCRISMEIRLRETLIDGSFSRSHEVVSMEVMRGPIMRGDSCPFRLYLSSCAVESTSPNCGNMVSLRYFIRFNLWLTSVLHISTPPQEIFIWNQVPKFAELVSKLNPEQSSRLVQLAKNDRIVLC